MNSQINSTKRKLVVLLAIITVLFVGGLAIVRSNSAIFRVEHYWSEISAAAREQGFEPSLIAAIAYVESKGNPEAVSSAGAIGLMQLKAEAAAQAAQKLKLPPPNREQLFDPRLNLRLGASYLAILLNQFHGNHELAVMAYFAGPGTIEKELEKSGGNAAEMKSRLMQTAWSAGEYLAQVLDLESRFRERKEN